MKEKNSTLSADLAEHLGKSTWWIYDTIRHRGIPFIPVGREMLFDLKAIDTAGQKVR